jgi:hypothetical protein
MRAPSLNLFSHNFVNVEGRDNMDNGYRSMTNVVHPVVGVRSPQMGGNTLRSTHGMRHGSRRRALFVRRELDHVETGALRGSKALWSLFPTRTRDNRRPMSARGEATEGSRVS